MVSSEKRTPRNEDYNSVHKASQPYMMWSTNETTRMEDLEAEGEMVSPHG
jgi:hypothetical protein